MNTIVVSNGREKSFLFTIISNIFHELMSEQITKRLIWLTGFVILPSIFEEIYVSLKLSISFEFQVFYYILYKVLMNCSFTKYNARICLKHTGNYVSDVDGELQYNFALYFTVHINKIIVECLHFLCSLSSIIIIPYADSLI